MATANAGEVISEVMDEVFVFLCPRVSTILLSGLTGGLNNKQHKNDFYRTDLQVRL